MNRSARIMLVEDDQDVVASLSESLSSQGYEIDFAEDLTTALVLLTTRPPDLVLLDIHLPGAPRGGLELLRRLRTMSPRLPVIMVSGKDSKENLLEAGGLGVCAFLSKGEFGEQDLFSAVVQALESRPPRAGEERGGVGRLLGESLSMRRLRSQIQRFAPLDMPVMITGPTGCGKELVAQALHEEAPGRSERPLVVVNCAAIPESIMESHLFGHRRGAFTGAIQDHPGLIQQANGSSLFLDEVGELSPAAQQRFLRFLETGQMQAVGDRKSSQVQTRVITASHQDLVHQVRIGRFREDLWFRLNVLTVETPTLKERMEDLEQLCRHFLDQASQRNHLPPRRCSEAALDVLRRHDWPGNVRELRNLMERLVATSDTPWVEVEELHALLPHHPEFHQGAARPAGGEDSGVGIFPHCVEEIQPLRSWRVQQVQNYVQHALRLCGGNVTRAAELLHIDRTTLYSYTTNPVAHKDIS
ncbi:MAG: sigma-54 dependent transcriptional regulator [Candidatus Delongbacteria bacterium]